ncbi:MAG: hypothetical protein WAU01_10425 [Saprospiraceae bacterium]
MKILVFILSLVILSQSLSAHRTFDIGIVSCHTDAACAKDMSTLDQPTKHQCCSKDANSSSDEDAQDDCCGDDCKCFCCLKVLLTLFAGIKGQNVSVHGHATQNMMPIMAHSFDFHPSISYPPQA